MFTNLSLLVYFIKKDVKAKYAGSVLGALWSVVLPLLQILIFWFVFDEIMKARPYAGTTNTHVPYLYFLLSTILCWTAFAEGITRASTSIIEHSDMIKKVSFPNIYLPISVTISSYVQPVVGLLIFMIVYSTLTTFSPVYFLLLPVVLLQLLLTMGTGMILSALLPFLRDMGYVIGHAMQGLFFLSPIMYSIDKIPEKFRILFYLNPFAHFASTYHKIILFRELPTTPLLLSLLTMSLSIFALGCFIFSKFKDGFSDVL
ncbi:MAG: ABC transporter permease [Magnetococcales bacterium]|uniref:Transport permease protein n=1 Tax=Candidatus Magnetobacterium casense TaxID=1455061 RepID=A0ABS6S0Z2_9BACT|nr:ABC transporter permease [Candidatus Magnetobacterium casensis]MBF0608071.1 ABC transporter permease [Nitrospirota bacterium]MBV6342068.1 ABC transporter permease [Candidatus Magnetobacterium casensis]